MSDGNNDDHVLIDVDEIAEMWNNDEQNPTSQTQTDSEDELVNYMDSEDIVPPSEPDSEDVLVNYIDQGDIVPPSKADSVPPSEADSEDEMIEYSTENDNDQSTDSVDSVMINQMQAIDDSEDDGSTDPISKLLRRLQEPINFTNNQLQLIPPEFHAAITRYVNKAGPTSSAWVKKKIIKSKINFYIDFIFIKFNSISIGCQIFLGACRQLNHK